MTIGYHHRVRFLPKPDDLLGNRMRQARGNAEDDRPSRQSFDGIKDFVTTPLPPRIAAGIVSFIADQCRNAQSAMGDWLIELAVLSRKHPTVSAIDQNGRITTFWVNQAGHEHNT